MSTVKVNTISTWTGNDVGIETGKTISGTASQFKMTDVVQGDVLYGSAADTLSRLAPGTSGQYLQTAGAGANPAWATVAAPDNAPSFSAYAASTGLTTATYNKITAGTELYDVGGCYDTSTGKFTVPAGEAGKYAVWTRSTVSNTAGIVVQNMGQWMYLNGTANQKNYHGAPANSTSAMTQTFFSVFDLSAADYLEWYLWITFSSGTMTLSTDGYNSWGAFKLAGA